MGSAVEPTLAYNSDWLHDNLNIDMEEEKATSLFAMDNPQNVQMLSELGTKAATVQVNPDHFPGEFDLG